MIMIIRLMLILMIVMQIIVMIIMIIMILLTMMIICPRPVPRLFPFAELAHSACDESTRLLQYNTIQYSIL